MAVPVDAEESLAAKFAALFPHLDERQRRLVMGAQARALGQGGTRFVARAAGVSSTRTGMPSSGTSPHRPASIWRWGSR
jgi:hypothetical protein